MKCSHCNETIFDDEAPTTAQCTKCGEPLKIQEIHRQLDSVQDVTVDGETMVTANDATILQLLADCERNVHDSNRRLDALRSMAVEMFG